MDGRFAAAAAVALLVAPPAAGAVRAGRAPLCLGRVATIVGTRGDDRIEGTGGRDVIVGGGGSDVIHGGDGRDRICGGAGDDDLDGRYGDDLVSAGPGDDGASGGPGDDLLLGGRGRDRLRGGDGSDTDTLVGGRDADTLRGGDGELDRDFLFGGEGDDFVDGGLGGDDVLYGGPGDDYLSRGVVSFELSEGPVVVSLGPPPGSAPNATGEGSDFLWAVDGVTGSPYADSIVEDDDEGRAFRGLDGDDVIAAGGGSDSVDGGGGSDELDGGPGGDLLRFEDSPAGVTASLVDGTASDGGVDSLTGFEAIEGSFFDDRLTGDDGANTLDGSYGANEVFGLGGDDLIRFAVDGDAGDGTDECVWADIPCERSWHFDPPSLPFVEHPAQGAEVELLRRVAGGIAGGLGGRAHDVLVTIRRVSPGGCWWWDARADGFVRGACGVPVHNVVPVEEGGWSLSIDARLARGTYQAGVTWAAKPYREEGCRGVFAPMCVSFDVR